MFLVLIGKRHNKLIKETINVAWLTSILYSSYGMEFYKVEFRDNIGLRNAQQDISAS